MFDSKRNKIDFTQERYETTIEENNALKSPLVKVKVVDYSDIMEEKGQRWFELRGAAEKFSINSSTGLIVAEKTLDREKDWKYNMLVVAFEKRENTKYNSKAKGSKEPKKILLSCTASILVRVTDVNDNAPVFSNSFFSFKVQEESLRLPQVVGTVTAHDLDLFPNNQFTFRIAVVTAKFSHEYSYEVSDNNQIKKIPSFNNNYQLEHNYGYSINHKNNYEILNNPKIFVAPNDSPFHYYKPTPSDFFKINNKTGELSLIKLVNREEISEFNLVIQAIDTSDSFMSSSCRVDVRVTDINDNAPIFIFPNTTHNTIYAYTPLMVGDQFGMVEAVDVDEGANGHVRYQISRGDGFKYFEVHLITGSVSISRPLEDRHLNRSFLITITAYDSGHPKQVNSTNVVISLQPAPFYPSFLSRLLYSRQFHSDILPTFVVCFVTLIIIVFLIIAIFKISRQKSFNHVIDSKIQTINPPTTNNFQAIPSANGKFLQTLGSSDDDSFKENFENRKKNRFNLLFLKFNRKKNTSTENDWEDKNNYINNKNYNYYIDNLQKTNTNITTCSNHSYTTSSATIMSNNTANTNNYTINNTTSITSIIANTSKNNTVNVTNDFINKINNNTNNNIINYNINTNTMTNRNDNLDGEEDIYEMEQTKDPTIKLIQNEVCHTAYNKVNNVSKYDEDIVSRNGNTDQVSYLNEDFKKDTRFAERDNSDVNISKLKRNIFNNICNFKIPSHNFNMPEDKKVVMAIVKNGEVFNELTNS